jgi:peptidoglycan/xylan/chitin deacetylase (PgdA/CDA1 family)
MRYEIVKIPEMRQREAEAWLRFVAEAETERAFQARVFQTVFEYSDDDFERVVDAFDAAGGSAGFAFLGQDVHEHAAHIEYVDGQGQEVVAHGHRHGGFADVSYEVAHKELGRGLDAIEDATGISPNGASFPGIEASAGAAQAAADLGLEWIIGRTEAAPAGLDILPLENTRPFTATGLLEDGMTPTAAFDELREAIRPDRTFLFHPPHLAYYDAFEEFTSFLKTLGPVKPSEQATEGGNGVVLDCTRPLKLA